MISLDIVESELQRTWGSNEPYLGILVAHCAGDGRYSPSKFRESRVLAYLGFGMG